MVFYRLSSDHAVFLFLHLCWLYFLFLPLFVFLPKLIQQAMKADADAAIEALGKNEPVKRVFWTLFVAMDGLVLARVVDPVTAQQLGFGIVAGTGFNSGVHRIRINLYRWRHFSRQIPYRFLSGNPRIIIKAAISRVPRGS